VEVQSGYVMMPELPGIGFEGKADLYRENEGAQQLTGSFTLYWSGV
jgi:L-alanine-DL-glutamate epimerase-like enolase superfamily enzyme